MSKFIVSYDLVKRKDYPQLWDEFKRLNGHKCLRSVYFVDCTATAQSLLDHLKGFVDGDDQLVVVEFDKRPATYRAF